MSKHTEGPWTVNGFDRNGQAIVTNAHIIIATCWHHCVGSIEKEMWANAHLIAAAPELLEALKVAKEFIENQQLPNTEWSRILDVSVAAIAKAEGRTAVKERES